MTPVCAISWPGDVSSQLPPVSAARSTITDPGRIDSTADAGIKPRRRTSRYGRRRDDDVELGDPLLERRLLRPLLLLRQLARVAALGLLTANPEVEERRTQRLDLLRDRGPHVERRDHRAETPRRRDRLQAGDPGAEHEDARRRDRPRRGHHHREQLRAAIRRQQHGLVPGDGRLRRQRVHRLRARDPRDRLHRERDDAALAQPRDPVEVGQRLEEADEHHAAPVRADLVGVRRADAEDAFDAVERAGEVRELRSCVRVPLVREPGEDARAALDDHLEPVRSRASRPSRARERRGALRARTPSGHRLASRRESTGRVLGARREPDSPWFDSPPLQPRWRSVTPRLPRTPRASRRTPRPWR